MKALRHLALFAFLLAISCKPDEPQPINMIVNSDMETGSSAPNGWIYSGGPEILGKWTDEAFRSGARSLKISAEGPSGNSGGFWAQQKCNDIPRGKTLVLKAMVKGNLSGSGVSVVLRGDDMSRPGEPVYGVQFVTTQGSTPITGTFDWKEYTVEIGTVDQSITCLWVFLTFLNNTTGEVYYDDVSLEHL